MNGNFLLDTNIVIALFDNDKDVLANLQSVDNVLVPSVVIGELYYGAFNSGKQKENIKRINDFRNDANILSCDAETGKHYGKIKKELKDKGNPIPENDIWIAALSIQYGIELITRDKHFAMIENLKTSKWKKVKTDLRKSSNFCRIVETR